MLTTSTEKGSLWIIAALAFLLMCACLLFGTTTSYADTDIQVIGITYHEPQIGESIPDANAVQGSTDEYSWSVKWCKLGESESASGLVEQGVTYFIGLTVEAKQGYKIPGTVQMALNGETITSDSDNYNYNVLPNGPLIVEWNYTPRKTITAAALSDISTAMDPLSNVKWTTKVPDSLDDDNVPFNEKMEIKDEYWENSYDFISRSDGPAVPGVNAPYQYSVLLQAKAGWNFPENADGLTLIYNGTEYTQASGMRMTVSSSPSAEWDQLRIVSNGSFVPAVSAKRISISSATVKGIVNKTYNGKNQTQNPTVILNHNQQTITLKYGTDYVTSYDNDKNPGTAKLYIDGRGKFTGSVMKTFTIYKAANTMTVKAKAPVVKYTKVKKKAQTIAAKNAFTVKNPKGTVTYTKTSGSNKITIAKTGKVTVKKKTKKGTYSVKIKVTAAGNSCYKAVSKAVTLKVKVK